MHHKTHLPRDGAILHPLLSFVLKKRNKTVFLGLEKHVKSQQSQGLLQMPKQSEEIAG